MTTMVLEPTAQSRDSPSTLALESFDATVLDRIVECVTTIWCADNVIARALRVTEDEYRPIARQICERALDEDLGLMIRERPTGRILGFGTAIDLVDELASEALSQQTASPRLRRWSAFLSLAHRWYLDQFHRERAPTRGEVVYMNIGGTLPELRGKGWISRMTHKAFVEFGLGHGYRRALAIATHPHSVRKVRAIPLPKRLHELRFSDMEDPDLAKITDPPLALVAALSLTGA